MQTALPGRISMPIIARGCVSPTVCKALLILAIVLSSISSVSAANANLYRCSVDGKVVLQDKKCPEEVDREVRALEDQRTLERQRKREEANRLEAERQQRIQRVERESAEAEARRKRAKASASDDGPVDCINLYLYGKNFRKDPESIVRQTVENARAKGTCQ